MAYILLKTVKMFAAELEKRLKTILTDFCLNSIMNYV